MSETKKESTGKTTDKCHRSYLHLGVKQEDSISLVFSLILTLNIMTNCQDHTLVGLTKARDIRILLPSLKREYGGGVAGSMVGNHLIKLSKKKNMHYCKDSGNKQYLFGIKEHY